MFSADIEDMYYNLDVNSILNLVQECVLEWDLRKFEEEFGINDLQLMKLLRLYLSSTVTEFGEEKWRQKSGICIGSKIAPILSNIFAAAFDRKLDLELQTKGVKGSIYRYVDDFLVLLDRAEDVSIVKDLRSEEH